MGNEPKRTYYANGQINYEEYWVNGYLHREDGPAFTHWHDNGQIRREEYWVNGNLRRDDGPAITIWYENGQIHREEFWLNGKEVTAYDVLDEKAAFAWVMANE